MDGLVSYPFVDLITYREYLTCPTGVNAMGYRQSDVYYQPEHFGLQQIAQIDYSDGSYQFDYRVIWRHTDGRMFTARDSGCSCPSPFEDYISLDMLEPFVLADIEDEANKEASSDYYQGDDIQPFLEKVRSL